ncbi:MAG: ABC transporter ATP-binding protein, partial [Lentisphaeria bacterium]|nr:ABC transporter ATP-binding protein [Lentisphaeria bacterium]
MKVEVVGLKRYFGRTKAVDGISFSFDTGHVFGFVGPNGSGKTTTMRILATLDDATEGDAFVGGVSVREYPEVARRCIGFVPDSLPEHADITVHEYLDFYARAYGLKGMARRQAVEAVEEFTNVTGIRWKILRELSKGMKQRVSVGRAMVHDPEVLIMDEPAAGLDPRARIELRELLAALGERNKAILISSHILTELTEICNGAVIIERGRILRTGTVDSLLQGAGSEAGQMRVRVRSLKPGEELQRLLFEIPGVIEARCVG